jgi:hypothetical protein
VRHSPVSLSTVRRLFGRSEPTSIYEHVRSHLRPDGPGLLEDGATLPDDEFLEGDLRWAPGALEGAFTRYADGPDDVSPRVEELHQALTAFARAPGRRERARVRRLFREDDARMVSDPLLERLASFPPADQERLYQELRTLLLESGYRGEVKFALVLVGAFGDPSDAEIFRTLARHEEFTLYAAIALANVVEDPSVEWLALLEHLDGWGKTEVTGLLLREPTPETCAALLRSGPSIGNALELAEGCALHEALAGADVDDELVEGARMIFDDLTWGFEGPEELADYDHAGIAAERFLELLAPRAHTLEHFLSAYELRRYVDEAEMDAERREQVGLAGERRARILELCDRIAGRPGWDDLARTAMEGEGKDREDGVQVAKRLGLPLREYLIRRIERDPNDSGAWFELVWAADEARIDEAVALAEQLWDLDEIATGPALELFGPPPEESPHQAFDFVLQELVRFPGKGWPLVGAGLRSPVIRHRHQALRVLSRWPGGLDAEREAAVRAAGSDPDEAVREDARKVLAGEQLEEPTLDLDEDV